MAQKVKVRYSPSERLLKSIENDKAIIKRVKTDIQSELSSIASHVSMLEKLQRYYVDLLKRTRQCEEQLFRLQYSDTETLFSL